ncbi:MAG TPA: hypothetical protein VE862_11000 [Candidatus Acidoferrum sp.]|nr:hypothetical protein [Candidatus Acidoferrum sp.]
MSALTSNYEFAYPTFFPESIFNLITEARVGDPKIIQKSAQRRKKREKLTVDGKLAILACDHPGRFVTKNGNEPIRMGNRHEYLSRILRVVTSPKFDGVMSTTDILEDLLIIDQLVLERGGESFLDGKVLVGCMNRGGLSGSSYEMDDRFTSFTAASIHRLRLDAAKFMFRLDLKDSTSLDTIVSCANAITELNALSIPSFLETFSVQKTPEGGYKTLKTADEMIKVVGVASALCDSSQGIWLKIPYCDGFERVAKATTCPILMLGGESVGDPTGIFKEFTKGMVAGKTVRGALVGRNILYPGNEDPSAVADAVSGIVHQNFTVQDALQHLVAARGQGMPNLTKHFV